MEEIRRLEEQWMEAWLARDSEAIDRLLHRRFTLRSITTDTLVDRAAWREEAVSGRVSGTSFRYDDMTIVEAGDAAIVDARLSFTGEIAGEDWSTTTWVTDVWTRETGRWQVVRRHASLETGRAGGMRA